MDAIFDYRLPSPSLREYVRMLQIVGCSFPASMATLPVKSYWPRAENSLAFYPKDPEKLEYGFNGNLLWKPCSTINGQYSIVTNRHVGHDFMVFQVQFQPGDLFRLTGIPVCELTNTITDAESIFSTEIKKVNERLSYTNQYTEMIPIVEKFLFYRINRAKRKYQRPIDKISQFLIQHPAVISNSKGHIKSSLDWPGLDWLADQACLSQRQFYRQFVESKGVSPKLFSRIARFENAMKFKNARPLTDWLTVAVELGYYDYQHLARDFKEFTQFAPNAFLDADTKSPERVFGVTET